MITVSSRANTSVDTERDMRPLPSFHGWMLTKFKWAIEARTCTGASRSPWLSQSRRPRSRRSPRWCSIRRSPARSGSAAAVPTREASGPGWTSAWSSRCCRRSGDRRCAAPSTSGTPLSDQQAIRDIRELVRLGWLVPYGKARACFYGSGPRMDVAQREIRQSVAPHAEPYGGGRGVWRVPVSGGLRAARCARGFVVDVWLAWVRCGGGGAQGANSSAPCTSPRVCW